MKSDRDRFRAFEEELAAEPRNSEGALSSGEDHGPIWPAIIAYAVIIGSGLMGLGWTLRDWVSPCAA